MEPEGGNWQQEELWVGRGPRSKDAHLSGDLLRLLFGWLLSITRSSPTTGRPAGGSPSSTPVYVISS